MLNKKLSKLYEKATKSFDLALGYPVNRDHAFDINLDYIGFKKNTFATCFLNNIGSPYTHGKYLSDHIKDLEVELLNLFANHLGLETHDSFGYVISGGTEGNFASVWWHREYLKKKFKQLPVLISSAKSHYSVGKIANQLGIQLIQIEADYSGINIDALENTLKQTDSPVIFWSNFGATIGGSIDNIIAIKSLLDQHVPNKYKIHGDGAIYGLFIPYLEMFKNIVSIFDYIDSISISGHKFLGAYQMCGIVLCKKSYLDQVFANENKAIGILQNISDVTVSGCRSGVLAIELYLLLTEALKKDNNGKANMLILWNACVEKAKWLYQEISKVVGKDNPYLWYNDHQLNIIIPAPKYHRDREFIANKYKLMPIGDNSFGIYIFPKSSWSQLQQFLKDYSLLEF